MSARWGPKPIFKVSGTLQTFPRGIYLLEADFFEADFFEVVKLSQDLNSIMPISIWEFKNSIRIGIYSQIQKLYIVYHASLCQFHHPRPCIKTLAYSKMTQDYVEWVHDSQWNQKLGMQK